MTVEDAARSVAASVKGNLSLLLVSRWVAERYTQLASKSRPDYLRRIGELIAPGEITTGTASVTQNTKVVTGTAAAEAAWSPSVVGRHFRASNSWYEIANFDPTNTDLKLKSTYTETTVSAGSYSIAARYVNVDPKVRTLGDTLVMARTRKPIGRITLEEANYTSPGRLLQRHTEPNFWVDMGFRPDSESKLTRYIELYPPLKSNELFYYSYWEEPPNLGIDDQLPPSVDLYVLKEGALIDAWRYLASEAADKGQVEMAAFYRNESRTQMTTWDRIMREAIAADRNPDDATFILSFLGSNRRIVNQDIRTARDEVFARGSRP